MEWCLHARYTYAHTHAHMRIHTHALYRACSMTFAKYKRYWGLCTVEPESRVKLLVRIRERIEIVYITIVFVSVLVGFVIIVILIHVTWALAWEWALSIRTARTVTWALIREGSGHLLGTLWYALISPYALKS